MKLLDMVFGRKRRAQNIAWLTIEEFSPITVYVSRKFSMRYIVSGGKAITMGDTYVGNVDYLGGPVCGASWDIFSSADLEHFVIIVPWLKEQGKL